MCFFLELNLYGKLRCMRPTGGDHLSSTTSTTFVDPVVCVAAICSVSLGLTVYEGEILSGLKAAFVIKFVLELVF